MIPTITETLNKIISITGNLFIHILNIGVKGGIFLNEYLMLKDLELGSAGKIKDIKFEGMARRRILDLGFVPNTIVKSLFKSPSSDPIAFEVRGTVIALRSEESSKIIIEKYP